MNKAKLIIVSGPSGVGKKTILDKIYQDKSLNVIPSISMTTRNPRPGEKNGIDYFFVTKKEFDEEIKNDGFLEYAEYNNNYYGTPKKFIESELNKNKFILLEIETEGVKKLDNTKINALKIFIEPPSLQVLKERLINRGTENIDTINQRINKAEKELKLKNLYDISIINDNLEEAVRKMKEIIRNYIYDLPNKNV